MPDVIKLNEEASTSAPQNTALYGWLVDSGMSTQIVLLGDFEEAMNSIYSEEPEWEMTITPLYQGIDETKNENEEAPTEEIKDEKVSETPEESEANGEFSITYEVDGGALPDDAAVTYSAESPVTLPEPTKDGYTFVGWFEAADFSSDPVTSTEGQTGDKTYYAKWEVVSEQESSDANTESENADTSEETEGDSESTTSTEETDKTDPSANEVIETTGTEIAPAPASETAEESTPSEYGVETQPSGSETSEENSPVPEETFGSKEPTENNGAQA